MKKVLAVSGGVDSMVMLDMACSAFPRGDLIIATFDHRTRESSGADARFVHDAGVYRKLVTKLGTTTEDGPKSEEEARELRYKFLETTVKDEKEGAEIYTAHHLDDLVETIAINLARGTGVRGLAVLNRTGVRRPFLEGLFGKVYDRSDILKYAAENGVVFRQDPTNSDEKYLRNRLRQKVLVMSHEDKMAIYELWLKQKAIMREIDEIVENLIPESLRFERSWFKNLDEAISLEVLRAALLKVGVSATRPQLLDFLKAILTYKPGKRFNLPGDKFVKFGRKDFSLKLC